jgi:hypothetical protein
MTAALMAVLLLPSLAMATHFEGLSGSADCEGWSAEVTVQWRTGIYEGTLDYTIQLQDAEGAVLEEVIWSGPFTRGAEDPVTVIYEFSGTWEEPLDQSDLVLYEAFSIDAPWDEGVDVDTTELTTEVSCNVPVDETSWSAVKSLYR